MTVRLIFFKYSSGEKIICLLLPEAK